MNKVFVKLKDAGSTFHIPGTGVFVGKRAEEVSETADVATAIRLGVLVKMDEKEYKEHIRLQSIELAEIKRIEDKAIEMGNPNNLDAAKLALEEENKASDAATFDEKLIEVNIDDMTVKELTEALSQYPEIEIPEKAKKADLVKLLMDAAEAEKKANENKDTQD